LAARLKSVAERAELPASIRLDALAAVPGGPQELSPGLFDWLKAQLDPDQNASLRVAAADILSRAKLDSEQLGGMTHLLQGAGPLEAGRLLAAFQKTQDEAIGLKLVAALKDASSPGSW